MTTFHSPAPSESVASGWAAFLQILVAPLRALEREARLRSAEQTLEALPDLILKDIGVSRGSIRHHVRAARDRRAATIRPGTSRSRVHGPISVPAAPYAHPVVPG